MKSSRRNKGKTRGDSQRIHGNLEENRERLQDFFRHTGDVKVFMKAFFHERGPTDVLFVYCESICDLKQLNEVVIPRVHDWLGKVQEHRYFLDEWSYSPIRQVEKMEILVQGVFDGEVALMFEGREEAYLLDIAAPPKREPEEPKTESSIRGPRDGFVEELTVNVGLIRKRLKTRSLCYEEFTIGTRSQTRVALLYLDDVVNQGILRTLRAKLSGINIDSLNSSALLEEMMMETPYALFPIFDYTGRPDFAVDSLLRGRFCLIVDGSPTVIRAPINLLEQIKSGEDKQLLFLYPWLEFLLRFWGLSVGLLLPGLWVALVAFHQDQLPFPLLATSVSSRQGVPFPTPVEAFVMLLLFELFREAGVRLPEPIGQILSVVGGLIIGDAAIRAGLASPGMIVVIALSAVSGYTLVNQSLSGTMSVLRFGVLLISSVLGLFGFMIALFGVILYLAHHKSFGLPYLAPISPLHFRDLLAVLFRPPAQKQNLRPSTLHLRDVTRQGRRERG